MLAPTTAIGSQPRPRTLIETSPKVESRNETPTSETQGPASAQGAHTRCDELLRVSQQPDAQSEGCVQLAAHVPPPAVMHVVPSQHTAEAAQDPPAALQEPTGSNGEATNAPRCVTHPIARVMFAAVGAV